MCKKEYPATIEFFYKRSGGKFGLHTNCKRCFSKRSSDYYIKNSEHIKNKVKEYRNTSKGREVKRKNAKKYKRSFLGKESNRRWKRSDKAKILSRKYAKDSTR